MNDTEQKTIGGFFPIELGTRQHNYHTDAIALTSGRACFNLMLTLTQAQKVYLPYYICDTILIPLKKLNIAYEFYAINKHLQPETTVVLKNNEYFLYVNYFGISSNIVDSLYEQYGNRLIIDNTQAFFAKQYKDCWSFNSARKFFGVPDGGYVYAPTSYDSSIERNHDIHYTHLIERLLNMTSAHETYKKNEAKIHADILGMSLLSEKLLSCLDYAHIADRRQLNFSIYKQAFSTINQLAINMEETDVPFCYPLLCEKEVTRSSLIQAGIFIPQFWEDVIHRNLSDFKFEKQLATKLLPLPIDHRYEAKDCERIINFISEG